MMDEDGLSNRNWGYYEPSQFRSNLGFQLIPSTVTDRNEKPFLSPQNPNFINPDNGGSSSNVMPFPRDYNTVPEAPFMSYSWLNQHRDSKFFNNFLAPPDQSRTQPMQLLQIPKPEIKRRQCSEAGSKRKLKDNNNVLGMQRERSPLRKKTISMVINGVSMDIGCLPVPVCSCTGPGQPCYRWGCGGWQSSCCTTNVSMYPLPMSTKRRGTRIAGRKMSLGAFRKVLEKLSSDGFDFSNPIDLKSHWAKHGTNKFVTIK
ncbi:unnamed protein product [Microthlaspi erraticum]|uniref:GAGA-binding transcriptional activator n=1 Tax=Microthlaspi erraticum TaxID=1685480 RepID=A0A6D2LAV7_9BRAS|nr:unnamed protein product [Microthlaspi erraticum]